MFEVWKPVVGYEGLYEVSNTGIVRSLDKIKDGYADSTYLLSARIMRTRVIQRYESVGLTKEGKQKNKRVHRLVAEAFVYNKHSKPYVNHIDGNKLNNSATNLEWVTSKENSQHAKDNNLLNPPVGERNGSTHLTSKQVDEIRNKYKTGKFLQRELAKLYRTKQYNISRIINYKRWIYEN